MVDSPPWDRTIHARRLRVENAFSQLEDWGRIALRRDKNRQGWVGFARLVAAPITLRITEFSAGSLASRALPSGEERQEMAVGRTHERTMPTVPRHDPGRT